MYKMVVSLYREKVAYWMEQVNAYVFLNILFFSQIKIRIFFIDHNRIDIWQ